jgi:hypothetical protein
MELIEYKEMREAIARVRELHKPRSIYGWLVCQECDPQSCGCSPALDWPCPTIQALDGEQ